MKFKVKYVIWLINGWILLKNVLDNVNFCVSVGI